MKEDLNVNDGEWRRTFKHCVCQPTLLKRCFIKINRPFWSYLCFKTNPPAKLFLSKRVQFAWHENKCADEVHFLVRMFFLHTDSFDSEQCKATQNWSVECQTVIVRGTIVFVTLYESNWFLLYVVMNDGPFLPLRALYTSPGWIPTWVSSVWNFTFTWAQAGWGHFPTSWAWARTLNHKNSESRSNEPVFTWRNWRNFNPCSQVNLSQEGLPGKGGWPDLTTVFMCKCLWTFDCKRVTRRSDSTRAKKQPKVV